jgi:pre-mRNA-splicing factor 18
LSSSLLLDLWAGEQADTSSRSTSNTPLPESHDQDSIILESAFNIPNNEAIRRLRAKGQPIRLFGESDRDRRLRLRALELIEERGHEKAGTNDFRKALEDVESVERELRAKNDKGKKKDDGEVNNSAGSVAMVDLGLLKTDPDKLYPVIYYALKRTLKEWEEAMDERPGASCTSVNPICLTGDTQKMSSELIRANWPQQRKFNLLSI